VRRRGKGNSVKILKVIQEKNNINISPYIVKSESKASDNDKALNLVKKFESGPKFDINSTKNHENTKEKSKERIDKSKKIEIKEESDNQDIIKIREDSEKKLTLNDVPEKNDDLDFENKTVYLKDMKPQNNRPNTRKRSAFKCLEEIEKEINNTPKNAINDNKINYLHTVNTIINDNDDNQTNGNNKNNNSTANNLNNFNKLINNSIQKPFRDRKPENKYPAPYNKITVPLLGVTNNADSHSSNNHHLNFSHNKDVYIGNNQLKQFNSYNIECNENSKKINNQGLSGVNNLHANNKKPEYETRRRKLINNNNGYITAIDNNLNLNQTTANPNSNNLTNFENQIKNAGMFNQTNGQNIPTRITNIGNIKNYNDYKGSLHTPINIKDNNDIYSCMNNTNALNSNAINLTKLSNVNSRIESRRVPTNAANNIVNHSYFATNNQNITSAKDKDSNKNKNFLII